MSEPVVHAFPRPEGGAIPDRIYASDQVITGEAVALQIRPASPIQLIGAGVIDVAWAFSLIIAATVFLVSVGSLDAQSSTTYLILAYTIALVFVPATVETISQGRSLGKWALGVQIVRDDGGAIRFRHAFIRSLVGMFEIFMTLGAIALVSTIANSRHKRLGDLVAGTYPVAVGRGAQLPAPLIMPPELTPWARSADVSRLPGSLAWRVRQFLNQGAQLAPERREAIAADLAAQVQPLVAPFPPPGTHPERFLAAVLVVRRDAEYQTLRHSQEDLRARLDHPTPYGLSR